MPATRATIETTLGSIELELWPDVAPRHVENFEKLVRDGFYDGLVFHRVIPDFMIQTGCPLGSGTGGPGWTLEAEFTATPFHRGTVGMARSQDPNSAGSQFFICVADCDWLNGQYTAFGEVSSGQDVADAISRVPRDRNDRPKEEVAMTAVRIA